MFYLRWIKNDENEKKCVTNPNCYHKKRVLYYFYFKITLSWAFPVNYRMNFFFFLIFSIFPAAMILLSITTYFFLICKSKKDIKMKKEVSVHKNDECCFLPRRCYSCRTTPCNPWALLKAPVYQWGRDADFSKATFIPPRFKSRPDDGCSFRRAHLFSFENIWKMNLTASAKKKATVSSIFQSRLLFLSSCAPLSLSVAVKGHLHPSWCYGVLFQRHLW